MQPFSQLNSYFPFRQPATSKNINTSISENSKIPTKRFGMYERSMLGLQARKQKLALLELELMRKFTFTPTTNSASWQAGQTPPWERLHRQEVKKQLTMKSHFPKQFGSRSQQSSNIMSAASSGIDKLHEDGRRHRNGKAYKKVNEARRRRFRDLQLRHCTLKPKLCQSMEHLSSIRCELLTPSFPLHQLL